MAEYSRWQTRLVCTLLGLLVSASVSAAEVRVLDVSGAIGPATTDYIANALTQAERDGDVSLIVLRIDTPGGLDAATREINELILNAELPFASLVTPAGARAASAGTYILYASAIAAMAPSTHLGAATPVSIGGSDLGGATDADPSDKADASSARERKAVNDSAAYIRTLAERHGRNADWAERAVREAVSLSASEALEQGVIDIVANDVNDLLRQVNGRTVVVADGEVTLATENLTIVEQPPSWRTKLLALITEPTVAYLLFLVGLYGLLLEGYNPGTLVAGVIGVICLLLALFAFQALPVNYAGLALIVVGIGLLIGESIAPSFGVLGLGGIVAFVIGSIMLMDGSTPEFGIPMQIIGTLAALAAAGMLWLSIWMAKLRRRTFVGGQEALIGAHATALEDFANGAGRIRIHGEDWQAVSHRPIAKGETVQVIEISGLTMSVVPSTSSPDPAPIPH